MTPRTTCMMCGDELWTALEAHGMCSRCVADESPPDSYSEIALDDPALDEEPLW